jgi:adenosyl cobinamide kinase/adenosyl cobinamide phosphate guanylyltransferase
VSEVPDGVTLLLGGARSGKSSLAVDLGQRWSGPVVFVATARTDVDDLDLEARVARHRAERPARWETLETTDVVAALREAPADALVIVDCITLWVADAFTAPEREATVHDDAQLVATVAAGRRGPTVLVSNEVGLGVHPASELGRRYRDVLGRVNVTLARAADRTVLLVAGRALPLVDPWTMLR